MKSAFPALVVGTIFLGFNVSAVPDGTNTIPSHSMLTMGGAVTTSERKASPLFTGETLPLPPEQHAEWSPPETGLPTNYVSATRVLFEQGMADPRGCDYREIEVGTGEVWRGDGGVVSTHGWVFPGDAAQKFAVCWNGLVYPAVSVGTNADLDADVTVLETNGVSDWYSSALPEAVTVSQSSLLGLKGCLLLRLEKINLATRLWLALERRGREEHNAMMRGRSETNHLASTNEIALPDADPYLNWASDWAWAMFDRTSCAHERGDEKLALLTARQLAAAQPQIEAECARRGFKRQPYWDSRRQKEQQAYLNFLEQFPALLADLERRDKEGPRISVFTIGLTNIPDQPKRVAALIHDLDLAQAHQWGQPGGVNLAGASAVSALIAEGDVAVEPLMDCLENDRRLTRSVGFGRDFHRGRTVLTVKNAADVALKTILQAEFSNVTEMRAYWEKYGRLKIEKRWYEILKDDSASARWGEAAANIVQPQNVTHFPGGFSMETPLPTNASIRLRGEPLRSLTHPSVTELLTRKALAFPTNNVGAYDLGAACQFAEYLAKWDLPAALPVAKSLSRRAATVMKYSGQPLGEHLSRLALIRAATDPQAFDEYADWIVTITPEQLGYSIPAQLEPLKKFPTNAVLRSAAEKMFGQTNSAWSRLPWKENRGGSTMDSELVALPAYRVLLVRELQKTNFCGTVSWQGSNYLNYALTNYQSGGWHIDIPQAAQPTNGATSEIRWCDWIALGLANGKHISFFNPFAPVAERNQMIEAARIQLLRK
jgi:hypothetical protein